MKSLAQKQTEAHARTIKRNKRGDEAQFTSQLAAGHYTCRESRRLATCLGEKKVKDILKRFDLTTPAQNILLACAK